MSKNLTLQEATDFFSELFGGEHHLPSEVDVYGLGYCINCRSSLATFDGNQLTRLVLMAHDKCYRAEIKDGNKWGRIKICIWKRIREGSIDYRHPTIEQAIEHWKSTSNNNKS